MAMLLPNGEQVFLDEDGNPLSLGTIDFYVPTTTFRKNTWQDHERHALNQNPLTLDAAGRATIFGSGAYRQVLKKADGTLVWDKYTSTTDSEEVFDSFIETFTADGVQTTFTASQDLGTDPNGIEVYVKPVTSFAGNGGFQLLNPESEYTINGTLLTLATAPAKGQLTVPPYSPSPNVMILLSSNGLAAAVARAEDAATEAEAAEAGAQAANIAFSYTFSTSVVMADPGTGLLRVNNADPALVSALAISALTADAGNPDISDFITTWDNPSQTPRSNIGIRAAVATTLFQYYGVTGAIVDNGTWLQIPVTRSAGAAAQFTAALSLYVNDQLNGANGAGTVNSVTVADGTLVLGGTATDPTLRRAALTGDVTVAAGSNASAIANLAVTTAAINTNAVTTVKILDANVTLPKLATQGADTFLANATGGAASPTAVALAASQLAGKGSTGNIAAIALGTNLSMSGATLNASGGLTLATPQATTSGSSKTFTPVTSPKQIFVSWQDVSFTTQTSLSIQIGTGGTLTASGYKGGSTQANDSTGVVSMTANSAAFSVALNMVAANKYSGNATLTLLDASNNIWSISGSNTPEATGLGAAASFFSGSVTLAGTCNILGFNSGGTFDAGTVNISSAA